MKLTKAILIGAGNLGKAIASHMNFNNLGFSLVGIFDKDKKLEGKKISGIAVSNDNSIEEFITSNNVKAAFLCVPKNGIDSIVNRLYNAGIRTFWNFSHYDISNTYNDTIVENVHLSDSLMTLCYRINENND